MTNHGGDVRHEASIPLTVYFGPSNLRPAPQRVGGGYELPSGARLDVNAAPAGTAGYDDLARGAAKLDLDGAAVPVAGLLDLLRIADASPDPDSRRHALAYRAVLDVLRAQHQGRLAQRPRDEDEIRQWLAKQTQVA